MAYGNPRKRAANNIRTTTLPKSLVDQLQSTDDGYRGGYVEKRAKTDRPAFRKDQRKQKRTEKKQRRTHYYQVGHGKDPSVAQVTKKVAKPTPAESKKQTKTAKKPTTTPDDEQAKNSRRLKKLAQTNPNFFSLLTDSQLGGLAGAVDLSDRPKSALQADQEREEKELRRLEKKLGIKKKGESKLPSFLNTDGLDDLFDDIQVGSTRLAPEPHGNAYDAGNARLALDSLDALDNDDSDDMLSESNEVEDDDGMEQLSDEYNSEEFTGFGGLDANEEASDSGVSDVEAVHSRVARARQLDQGHEVDAALHDDQPSTDSSDSDPATPIQGTLAPKNSTPVSHVLQKSVSDLSTSATTSARRYIPPHLRKQESDPASERLAKIRKQVQGLLNRLSESNIESILSQSEDIYRNFPRAEVTSVFATLLLQTLTNRTNLLASFVSLNAAFVAALYRIIGTEAAAHFVQETIEQFDKGYETALQQKSAANPSVLETDAEDPDDDDDADIVGKECVNLIALVCELYNFQVISHVLVYDLLTLFAQEINEVNVELLLKMIKTCGYQLRHDDPVRLKETILAVNQAVSHVPQGHLNARTKFMLEVLNNLRTNRLREGSNGGDSVLRLKKFLGNLTVKHTIRSSEALGVSLEDIRCIETKGKWWLVGSTWSGHEEGILGAQSSEGSTVQTANQDLLAMARRLNMNTDIRKSIFIVLMTSEDYVDCFERLTKLRLKEVQEREIARVLVQCCGSERIFNPYYSVIAERLCSYDHRFRVTFQYCLWDFLRQLGESSVGGLGRQTQGDSAEQDDASFGNDLDASGRLPLHRVVNVAKFYAHLVSQQALGLGILKPVNFAKLKSQSQIFLQMLFIHLFLPRQAKQREDFDHLITTFSKVSAHSAVLAQGILFFLHAYVRNSSLTKDGHEKQVVKWGCSIAKEVIESQASASAMQDFEM